MPVHGHTSAETERLSALVGEFCAKRVLVIGDLMLDEFVWGKVSRISPEAPVPVVEVTGESFYPGGAANVARNLRSFGAPTALIGAIGNDAPGERLIGLLTASEIETAGIQRSPARVTALKTRVVARNQQVVRVDREKRTRLTADERERAQEAIEAGIAAADAVTIADYNKGFLDQELADFICAAARRARRILTVDPHPHASLRWTGAAAVKPNRTETFLAAGMPVSEAVEPVLRDQALLRAAKRVRELWESDNLLVTLGEQGMLLFDKAGSSYHIPAQARDVFDVSGAGDTAIAVLTLGLAAGGTPYESAVLANIASSIVVGKLGTATVSAGEIVSALAQ
jgi:D-beta-D-heptose 7-phosphate kinase/D-beta-D-heptose 1-phosphate adenosyltransferase